MGDWSLVEREIGTRLPEDYKLFIAAYGAGTIGELPVWVVNPFAADPMHRLRPMIDGVFGAYKTLTDGGYELSYPLFPSPGGLLPFGATGNGDYLHWKTEGPPARWTVVIWQCDLVEFADFAPRGLAAFLADLVAGRLKVFPSEFFRPTPRFVPASS